MADTNSHTAPEPRTDRRGVPRRSELSQIRPRGPVSFGSYELLARLRLGGMAEVFKARSAADPDRLVAIKRILPSFTDEAEYVAMFLDEARLAMQLDHPAIVKALELGQVEDSHFIALEYVAGQDLATLLRHARERSEPLPLPIALRIAIQVCGALHHAHELCEESGDPLGVVHRDVSPPNIVISYAGEVKLIDFGIAKSREQLMRTRAGFLKGKHGYLSPEQASGEGVGPQSDIFSLGICLFEMLTAERLFCGASDYSTLMLVRKAEVPPLGERNPKLPAALHEVVHRALAKRPGERFATALELEQALEQVVAGEKLDADAQDVAAYMQERFADAMAREAAGEHADVAELAEESTGLLDAFDGLDPVSTVSSLAELPRDEVRTLQPPQRLSGEPSSDSTPQPSPAVPGPGMDWDDEELSTQIYDGPDGELGEIRLASGPAPVVGDLTPFNAAPARTAPGVHPPGAAPPFGSPPPEPVAAPVSPPASRTAWWVGAGLLAAIAVGTLALWWLRTTQGATLHVTTTPPDASVTLDGVRAGSNASPFVLTDVEAGEAHELVVSSEGHRPWRTTLTVRPGQQVELPHVTLTPLRPTAPQAKPAEPAAASPKPEAARPEPEETAAAGKPTNTGAFAGSEQKPPRARRSADRPPEAADPEPARSSPSAPAAQAAQAAQAVPADVAAGVEAPEEGTGTLRINSRPWSQVFVGGKLVGHTPVMGLTLSAGRHSITLVNSDFGLRKVLSVQIEPGETITRSETLEE